MVRADGQSPLNCPGRETIWLYGSWCILGLSILQKVLAIWEWDKNRSTFLAWILQDCGWSTILGPYGMDEGPISFHDWLARWMIFKSLWDLPRLYKVEAHEAVYVHWGRMPWHERCKYNHVV